MTPRAESNLERTVGRIEGQLESVVSSLLAVNQKLDSADDWRHEVKVRLERVESHSQQMSEVADNFTTLQQGIRDSKNTAKGVMVGIGLAAGAGGAAVASGLQKLWLVFVGA